MTNHEDYSNSPKLRPVVYLNGPTIVEWIFFQILASCVRYLNILYYFKYFDFANLDIIVHDLLASKGLLEVQD